MNSDATTTAAAEGRWGVTPSRLAYTFYGCAALAAVVGQVWVALRHIPFDDAWPVGWRIAVVLPFAACLELLGMATSALADERLRAGERAYGYRTLSAATAVFAVTVIVVGHWPHAYEVAGFGALSAAAYVLWLLHSAARRRDALRASGRLPTVAPVYGLARWLRHPVRTARARELAREHGYGLYESLRAAEEQQRVEARRPAIADAVEAVIRSDHQDALMAEIAARTLDPDKIAAELEARADYAGWAARLGLAVASGRAPAGSASGSASGNGSGAFSGSPDRASGIAAKGGSGASRAGTGRASGRRTTAESGRRTGKGVPWDRAQAEQAYRESVAAGAPLRPAELARRAGRDPKTAWRWIEGFNAELAASNHRQIQRQNGGTSARPAGSEDPPALTGQPNEPSGIDSGTSTIPDTQLYLAK